MAENEGFVLLKGELVLLELVPIDIVDSSELGLDQEGDLVGRKRNIDLHREPDIAFLINLLVECFFSSLEAHVTEFVGLTYSSKL